MNLRRYNCFYLQNTTGLLGRKRDIWYAKKGGWHNERRKKPMAVSEKYMLTIKEAAEYFNIGIKKMRRLAEDNEGEFAIYMGNRYLVIRERFE